MARTHVRIKGLNYKLYLETHATMCKIYLIRLRILPRNLVHYTVVWRTLYAPLKWRLHIQFVRRFGIFWG